MKNERFFLEQTEFFGYKMDVDLKNIGKSDFKALWQRLDVIVDQLQLDDDMFFIGYEDYRSMTPQNKTFTYYAMLPSKYFDEKPENMVSITLDKGHYIKFESNFNTHGPKVFQKAYKYLEANDIAYDNRFDFELIPRDAQPGLPLEDVNSILYICLKLDE